MNRRDRRKRLDDIALVSSTLRDDVRSAPDLTSEILSRVHEQRPFLDRRSRRWVVGSRLLACGVVICGGLFVAAVNRWAPDSLDLAPPDRPVSAVISALAASTTQLSSVPDAMSDLLVVNPALIDHATASRFHATVVSDTDSHRSPFPASTSGELTARCFVGPVVDCHPSAHSSAVALKEPSSPPITLSRTAVREATARPLSVAGMDRGWFEPVPLRTTTSGLVRVSLPADRAAPQNRPSIRTWSPTAIDILSPR
ncbi:MAG: hypothetical protein KF768_02990 [Phycisphaeraceae bacterium]|nr:hypothetical protein [Phycisphaeraceae bacterium]